MKSIPKYFAKSSTVLFSLSLLSGPVLAGGLIDLWPGEFQHPDDPASVFPSNEITNPWWPLPEGAMMIYSTSKDEDGNCEMVTVNVQGTIDVNGVAVRVVEDVAYFDNECDQDVNGEFDEELEVTSDWYAQDVSGNIWYFGEDTISYDYDECENPFVVDDVEVGCLDGAWKDGEDGAQRGLIMLTNPTKKDSGSFYFQEYYEDFATDMGKILNFKVVKTAIPRVGHEKDKCLRTKEWSPLSPGTVEHKYYCKDYGLVLVEENSGGPTVWEDLVFISGISGPSE